MYESLRVTARAASPTAAKLNVAGFVSFADGLSTHMRKLSVMLKLSKKYLCAISSVGNDGVRGIDAILEAFEDIDE